jgi:hypothetical protein
MAVAALGYAGLWVHEHRGTAADLLVELRLRRAAAAVDQHSGVGVRLSARLAAEIDHRSGTCAAILDVLDEARQTGDAVALAEAVSLAHQCLLGPEHGSLRALLAREMIAASFRTGRRSDLLTGLLWRTVDRLLDADPHAERGVAELHSVLARQEHLAVGYVTQAIDVMRDIRAGRLVMAEQQASRCAENGALAGDANATGWYWAQMIAIRWYQGRIAELASGLRSPDLNATDDLVSVAALAVASASAGDCRQASGALARLSGGGPGGCGLGGLPRTGSWLVALYGAVEAAFLLDDADTAVTAYDLLLPYAHLPMMAGPGIVCFGSVRHALGVASLTAGELSRAIAHLREALHDNLAIEHWPAVAMSRARLAQALIRRARPGDTAAAKRERDLAAHEATGLGVALPGDERYGPPVARRRALICRRYGRQWAVEFGQRTALVDDSRGMQYLAVLIANPGRDIAAIDLAAGSPGADQQATGAAQPVLDELAVREYRRRLAQLDAEIDEYDANHDLGRAARARTEREWLITELSAAAGLGGRVRAFASADERARISVGKAIRRATGRIGAADPVIGAEIAATVQTGLRCSYRPR